MGGISYVYWPGTTTRLTPWMLHCLQKLDADLRRLFGVHLVLDSSVTQRGIRTYGEQVSLFLSRYRVQASGNGPFGDVRYWQGRRYVRHSGLGTVAQPETSNHEIQGTKAAVDLADSGGPGIGSMGSARSNWLRANAANYGLIPEGFGFNEAWHYAIPNIFNAVPAGGGSVAPVLEPAPTLMEDDVTFICKTPINGSNANSGVYSWICDPAAGTKRNIDFAEYDFLKSINVRELVGLQSPAITNRYKQIN